MKSAPGSTFVGLIVTGMLLVVTSGNTARAGDVQVDARSVAVRIDLASGQRMLTERMAKFLCYARSGIDATDSALGLAVSKERFERTHRGFVDGDADLMLFAEPNISVKRSWRHVDDAFKPLAAIYARALGGAPNSEINFDRTDALTMQVLARSDDMVAQLRATYATELGADGFGRALLIDLYGRQRTLSQKLSKEVCLVVGGHEPGSTLLELRKTLKLFETSLSAFVDGMPNAGVPKPLTAEIAEQLDRANATWQAVRATAAAVAMGMSLPDNDLTDFSKGVDAFLVEMNVAVEMLAAHDPAGS